MFSAYKMAGTDKTVIRRKAGPSKEQIKKLPQFQRTRENIAEFGASSMAGTSIRDAVCMVRHLSDYNYSGTLNRLCKKVQLEDPVRNRGQRQVEWAQWRHWLNGFNFNKKYQFDHLIHLPVAFQVNRAQASAVVTIPQLHPGFHVAFPWQHPYFRFTLTLGSAVDVVYGKHGFKLADGGAMDGFRAYVDTSWAHCTHVFPETSIELQIPGIEDVPAHITLLLAIGVEMGTPNGAGTNISPVRRAGSAKILQAF
ncbi:hypothetical protein EGT74_17535 [Chitinophaga lutea]|uniref:Uncharacterized protein n=2 Tax=Chitinophaga lutea TaxID=2488634 RepID=A0A3N4PYR9_9BACT|nr:hypothetical protein EGT74_17535 [Chitinophaga lutea]